MPVITAGLITGGASLLGGLFGDATSAISQQQTNETNMQIAQMNNNFNAQQAALNRGFQQQMQAQTESFNAGQADTQVTRRMQDLQNAGLNPQLAIGNPAAAASVGTPGGATASSAGLPRIDAPGAAFGNLGNQTAQAIQTGLNTYLTGKQADLAAAQAKYYVSQTPTPKGQGSPGMPEGTPIDQGVDIKPDPSVGHELGDAALASINSNIELQGAQRQQVAANIGLINAQVNNTDADTAVKNITAQLQGQNLAIIKATRQAVIQQAITEGQKAGQYSDVMIGKYGRIITAIDALLPGVNTAISAAAATRGLGGLAGNKAAQTGNWTPSGGDEWKEFHLPMQSN